jgi:signal transduction histidine kinase
VAAGVAHDLNNVLTVITLCTELLAAQAELDEAGHLQLDQIRRESQRGASMVWQILDFAQRGPMARAPVDLDAFLGELVPVLRRTQVPGVSITFHADDAPHLVMGDAARLEQILSNLATNAADAIAGPGRIEIRLEAPEEGWVCVAFSDTGAGIPPTVLPQIFEPFFSTKPPGHGTGLGLAQVQSLVSQHGGRVAVSSVLGEGTTVEIWIPAGDVPATGHGMGRAMTTWPPMPGTSNSSLMTSIPTRR